MMPQSSNARAIRTSSHIQTTITSMNSTQVVMKVVQANGTNLDYLRLKREVEVLTQIQNDRFPRILDQFENSTRFGVVEEYLSGQKLGEWINRTKPTKKQRIAVFIKIGFSGDSSSKWLFTYGHSIGRCIDSKRNRVFD